MAIGASISVPRRPPRSAKRPKPTRELHSDMGSLGPLKTVNVLRNRVAHHEPLHNGFPLPGQRSGQQQPSRLTAAEGVETYMKLTRMIDRNLAK